MPRLVFAGGPGRPGRPRRRGAVRRPARRRLSAAAGYALCALVLALGLAVGRLDAPADPADPASAPSTRAAGPVRVIDGDTLDVAGERVRIANIDTPEMPPKARCASEAEGALRARDELRALVSAGPVVLERTGTDRYGRTLARVSVDGVDAGAALVASGHARPWEGRRRSWCA